MNHRNTTLAIAAIVSAIALTGVAFAVPQQVMRENIDMDNNDGLLTRRQ